MRKFLVFCILFSCSCCSSPSKCHKTFYKILREWSKEAKQIGLYTGGTGGGIHNDTITELGMVFTIDKVMHLEAAREKIVMACSIFFNILNEHPEYLEYLPDQQASLDILSVSVLGKQPEDLHSEFVSNVSARFGIVRYKTDDPEKKIFPYIHVHEESFETAVKILKEQGGFPNNPCHQS